MEENIMSFDEWVEEFGEIPTFEELARRYPDYSSDPEAAWEALEKENEESLARSIAQGRGY